MRMSANSASSSGCIQQTGGLQDAAPPDPVRIRLDEPPLDEVDSTADHPRQLALHVEIIGDLVSDRSVKGDQHVNIARGVEIIAQHRAKQLEPDDTPFAAELVYLSGGHA